MKKTKVTLLVAIISVLTIVLSPTIASAAIKAPKVSIKAETKYETSTVIEVGYVKDTSTYRIYRSTDNKKFNKIGTLSVEGTYTDTEIVPGTTYYYKVKACNLKGKCSKYSKVVSKTAVLNAPSELTVTDIGTTVAIQWQGDTDATGYDIERSTNNKSWKKVATKKSPYETYYSDTDVKEGKTYYYRVRAYKKIEGSKTYKTSKTKIKVNNTLPKVKNLSAIASDNGFVLSWNSSAKGLSFEVKRADSKNGKYTTINSNYSYLTSDTNYYYIDNGLKKNKTYYYKVRYYYTNSKGKKIYGKTAKLTTKTLTTGKAKKAAVTLTKNIIKGTDSITSSVYGNYYFLGENNNGLSKKDVITRLQSWYGYSESVAKYGAENAGINYKKQALKTANNTTLSKKQLESNLKNSTFTKKEVDYALKKTTTNFNTNARVYDRYLLNGEGISKEYLTEDLTDAKFTKKQVTNATKNVNYKIQALQKAESMLEYHPYTKSTLKNALVEFYAFTKSQAEYAVKNGKFDYVSNAITYLKNNYKSNEYNAFGKTYLINMLKDEGFSKSDAEKIVKKADINFKRQALKRAKSLGSSSYNNYSEKGLRNELISYYGFTSEEADYAIKNAKIDFNKQALNYVNNNLKSAINSSDNEYYYITKNAITSYLKEDGFTTANIEYAMKKSDANLWKQNAVKYVKYLVNVSHNNDGYSKAKLITNLTGQGFTTAEAEYAATNAGINYKEQAKKSAEEYYGYSYKFDLSRVKFIEKLVSSEYGYTQEEATYGVDSLHINFTSILEDIINNETNITGTIDDYKTKYSNLGFTTDEINTAIANTNFDDKFQI